MVVRVRVRLESLRKSGKKVEREVISTTGYESEKPKALIPLRVAEELGLFPELPPDRRVEEYLSASGKFSARKIPRAVRIKLEGRGVVAHAVLSEFEEEIPLNDATISALGVVIVDPKRGVWEFRQLDALG